MRYGIGLLLLAQTLPAQADDTAALAHVVKQIVVKHLPTPAVTSARNWNHQKEVTVRVNAVREGPLKWKLDPVKESRNDGHWTRISLTIVDPARNLSIELKDIATPESGKTIFKTTLVAPVTFKFEQQIWKAGLRLYSGETRGRFEAKAVLNCETVSMTTWAPDKLLPSQLFHVSVAKADVAAHDIKIDHTAGMGGEGAEKLGDAALAAIKLLKPDLEADLRDRANKAIVKAGQSREVRLDFEKMLRRE
jgi:hypothetical protein